MEKLCNHCSMDITTRNPSGYCDHLYYPDNCEVCSGPKMIYISEAELSRLREVEEVARELLASLCEVVALSDRKHDAWDRAKAAIAKAKAKS